MSSRPKPNLFIVGAPKCGTSAWVKYLKRRDDVFISKPKEPHYFNTDMPGFRWFYDNETYLRIFENAGDSKWIGESSIMYLYSTEAAQNIARFAPDAKIIAFVRSHGSFIRSYHQQLLYNRDESDTDLRRVWNLAGERPADQMPEHCRDPKLVDYKSVAAFSEQIERYLAHFPRESIKIVRFEDWTANPRATYLEILEFLGLEDDGMDDFPKINAAHRHRSTSLANLTQRPPGFISQVLGVVRKIPGLENWRPGRSLRRMNRSEGYETPADAPLIAEIDAHYAADAAKLERLVAGQ